MYFSLECRVYKEPDSLHSYTVFTCVFDYKPRAHTKAVYIQQINAHHTHILQLYLVSLVRTKQNVYMCSTNPTTHTSSASHIISFAIYIHTYINDSIYVYMYRIQPMCIVYSVCIYKEQWKKRTLYIVQIKEKEILHGLTLAGAAGTQLCIYIPL